MKYTVEPITVAGCDCEDCRAGEHLYELFRWQDERWHWVGISLQTYTSAEDCKQHHYWGDFVPDDTWEDGAPMLEPTPKAGHSEVNPAGKGFLNKKALLKSYEALKKHWQP